MPMHRCEILLAGILPDGERGLNKLRDELNELGLKINPHWWGCHQAVRGDKGVVVAIECTAPIKEDVLIARIRAALNRNPALSGRTEIRMYNSAGWHLTSATLECYAGTRNKIAA